MYVASKDLGKTKDLWMIYIYILNIYARVSFSF